jgi:hypothetical protein
MNGTTAARAKAAVTALRLTRIQTELNAQRDLFQHIIVSLDDHTWQLARFRAIAPLYGIKR